MSRNNTTDKIFAFRELIEKYREGQKELHCIFMDLGKSYDYVPRGTVVLYDYITEVQ